MKEKMDEMVKITGKIMECRPPPRVYAMCLKEQFLWFQLMRISRNLDPVIHTAKEFYDAYQVAPSWLKNNLCEFYLHGFLIPSKTEWNPLLYIGDIHLRSLMSWASNKTNYGRQLETYKEAERNEPIPL